MACPDPAAPACQPVAARTQSAPRLLPSLEYPVNGYEQLAHGYFRGPESFGHELRRGHLTLLLQQMATVPADPDGCSEFERILVGDLELIQKHARRVATKSQDRRLQSRAFFVQCHLLTGGLLSRAKGFLQILKQLHDRTRQA